MNTLSYKTISVKSSTVEKEWLLFDAEGQTLGRFASKVAKILRGKHKPYFTPHVDCGDNIVVINASKIHLTGMKWDKKVYIRHTGYPGGQRSATAREVFEKDSRKIILKAVKGMLPKNKLGDKILKNLRVYKDAEFEQEAQKPRLINLNDIK